MKFSVTIPSYKARYLREAIESVTSQTYPDWELIIVDDHSPEDLHSIAAPYLQDERIHYYRNEKNCGAADVVDNWNICLAYCTGQYVICIGDDDRLKPNCLEEYAQLIEKHPGLSVYHARTEIIDENGHPCFLQEERPEWESAISLLWHRWTDRPNQYIGDFCYDTEMLRREGGYYKLPLAWGSDDITAVRAAARGGIANTIVPIFEYRQNHHTITSSNNARTKMQASLQAREWFMQFINDCQTSTLSQTDSEMLTTIHQAAKTYYYKSLGKNCSDDLCGNPLRIAYWAHHLAPLHFSPLLYLKWYARSILNILTQ